MKKVSLLLILVLMVTGISTSSLFAQAWDDCVIPASGPWPACASGNSGGWTPPPSTGGGQACPSSGAWPAGCVPGGSNPSPQPPSTGGGSCVIPARGAWPACATGGGGTTPPPSTGGGQACPSSGAWPAGCVPGGSNPSPQPPSTGGGGQACPPSGAWPAGCVPGGTGGSNPSPQPPTYTPPSTGSLPGGYLFGAQTHTFANPETMKQAGMQWVKLQHKWEPGHDGEAVRERIQIVHNQGMKVLLSIVGQPYPSSINFNSYVQFLGAAAAENPDAIEIWSEPNIDFEWPLGQISATSYVNNMLKPGYQRIKSVNPNILVISGAPAPTGFFGGGCSTSGCDDKPYMEEMFRADAASYLDCVGIHYNVGISSPSTATGDPRGEHYSWYYPQMVSTYRDIIGDKPLCFTEVGYLSFEGFDSVSPRFAWASNTSVQQQAQWLGEVVTLTKNDPGVLMLIVFNMDIESFGDDPQAGYGMIRPDGNCPSCRTVKSAVSR